MKIRVGIVDSYPGLVLGVATLVNAQPEMVFAANSRSVREFLSSGKSADVIVFDPKLDATMTPAAQGKMIVARGLGAVAYLSPPDSSFACDSARVRTAKKTEPLSRLLNQIRLVHDRNSPGTTPSEFSQSTPVRPVPHLSPRERDVLELYVAGDTAARVASTLGIGRNTVLDHIKHIREKYAAVGRPAAHKIDLFRRAAEDGLITGTPYITR